MVGKEGFGMNKFKKNVIVMEVLEQVGGFLRKSVEISNIHDSATEMKKKRTYQGFNTNVRRNKRSKFMPL